MAELRDRVRCGDARWAGPTNGRVHTPSAGLRWLAVLAVAHGAVGVIVAASTLLMPMAAGLGLVALRAAGAALLIRWRQHPLRMSGVLVTVLAIWFAVAWAGDVLLGWTP